MELTGGNKCLYVCKEQVYEPAPVSYILGDIDNTSTTIILQSMDGSFFTIARNDKSQP